MYGEWNEQAQRHAVSFPRVPAAAAGFYDGVDLEALRRDVVRLTAPVLVVAGDLDAAPTPAAASGAAEVFRNGRAATTPGAHYPWLDDPAAFVSMIVGFLSA